LKELVLESMLASAAVWAAILFALSSSYCKQQCYSPDGPLTKLIKSKCPNTSHM